jgi:hypothetical protein
MKRVIMLCFALVVLIVPSLLFASSCESTEAEYYINFTLNGVQYSCGRGFTDVGNGNPFAAVQPGDWTFGAGTNVESSFYADPDGDFVYVQVHVTGTTVGTYSYSGEEVDIFIQIYTGGLYFEYTANSGSLEITTFGDVGSAVEGSFNLGLDLIPLSEGVVPLGTAYSVEGTFRVERINFTVPK